MKYLAIISLILLTSCSNSQVTLYGEIGNGLVSTFDLIKDDNNYSGNFYYDKDIEKVIKVNGFFENNRLVLNEYNDELEITGTFNGKFENSIYSGNWISPDKTSRIPFSYSINKNSISLHTTNSEKDDRPYKLKINLAYQKWITRKIETGEYWTEDTYHKKAEINIKKNVHWGVDSEEETGKCKQGIPNKLTDTYYLDINKDGIMDCISYVRWLYCSAGNWTSNIPSELLIFISYNNSYKIIENPKTIEGGYFKKINKNEELEFEHLSFDGSEARCCPSVQWFTYYKYVDNEFILIRKTSEKKKIY